LKVDEIKNGLSGIK